MSDRLMVNPYFGSLLIAVEEAQKRAIASASLAALIPKAETSITKSGTTLRQTLGTLLIRTGQRLHGTVVHSTDMLRGAS